MIYTQVVPASHLTPACHPPCPPRSWPFPRTTQWPCPAEIPACPAPAGGGRPAGPGQLPAAGGWRGHRRVAAALVPLERGGGNGLERRAVAGEPGPDRADDVAAVPLRASPAAAGPVVAGGGGQPGHGPVVAGQPAARGLRGREPRLRGDL